MTTQTTAQLTTQDIEAGYNHDEWLGFGYLGDRRRILEGGEVTAEAVAVADEMVLFHANRLGWTSAEFFAWLNSKNGRWSADILIGSKLGASTDGQLRRLMVA